MYVYICKHILKYTHIDIDYLHKNTHIHMYLRHSRRTQLRPPSHNAVDLCISCSCTKKKYASAYFAIGKGSYFRMFFHLKNIHLMRQTVDFLLVHHIHGWRHDSFR